MEVETLLNLCWLLLAVVALIAWRRQEAAKPHGTPGLIALLCVLVLMFPVISATDDLHPVAQAVEDASKRTQKRSVIIKSLSTHIKHGNLHVAGAPKPLVFEPTFECFLQAAPVHNSHPGVTSRPCTRPPPVRTTS